MRGVVFEGQDPFIMTLGRYSLLFFSELMDRACLWDPNAFPVGGAGARQRVKNCWWAEGCPLCLYMHGETLYIPGWDFWLGVGMRSWKQPNMFFSLCVQSSEGWGEQTCLAAPSPSAMISGKVLLPIHLSSWFRSWCAILHATGSKGGGSWYKDWEV